MIDENVILKPYLFTHPNPINAIISWIISWAISWQIIPYKIERWLYVVCQLIVQLLIALIGFG